MNRSVNTKAAYLPPETSLVCVEVESNLMASSVTEYENAGSAGEGSYEDNPFTEFGVSSSGGNSATTDSFDSWGSY